MKRYIFSVLFAFTFFIEATLHDTVTNVSTQENFGKLIKSKKITVAKFYTTWCGACTASETPFAQLADDPSAINAQFITIDIDAMPELAQEYDISYIPQFLIFRDGKFIKKQEFQSFETLKEEILSTIADLENDTTEDSSEVTAQDNVPIQRGTDEKQGWLKTIFDFIMLPIHFVLNILERIIEMIKGWIW